jgi:hypothetical protein
MRLFMAIAALAISTGLNAPSARADAPAERCVTAHAQAQRLRLGGQLLEARAQLLICAQSECPGLVSSDCGVWLAEVESSLSSVVFAVEGGDGRDLMEVRVFANGHLLTEHTDGQAIAVDPGRYVFRFETAGYTPSNLDISVRQSEKNRIVRVTLPLLAPPEVAAATSPPVVAAAVESDHGGLPVATYVLGGVTIASLGAFSYFAIAGKNRLRELQHSCGPNNCTEEQAKGGRNQYIAADIALGVGVASAIAVALVYIFDAGSSQSASTEPQARVGAAVTHDSAYLVLSSPY